MNIQNFSSLRTLIFIIITLLVLNACTSTRITEQAVSSGTDSGQNELEDTAKDQLALNLCKTLVSNPPLANNSRVLRKSKWACVNGVTLLVAPAPRACLSSGFGVRNNHKHNGIDYQSKPTGNVIASGNGTIVNVDFRVKDYGHWIIIDHGRGIYTSYAHLETVNNKIRTGTKVSKGQVLGKMGKTGNAASAIHLHFEMRRGNYKNTKGWWGLSPIDPFSQNENC